MKFATIVAVLLATASSYAAEYERVTRTVQTGNFEVLALPITQCSQPSPFPLINAFTNTVEVESKFTYTACVEYETYEAMSQKGSNWQAPQKIPGTSQYSYKLVARTGGQSTVMFVDKNNAIDGMAYLSQTMLVSQSCRSERNAIANQRVELYKSKCAGQMQ